jgi:hypothetical protein
MASHETLAQLGERIRVMVKKSDDYLVSAGLELVEAHNRIKAGEGRMTFDRFLKVHCHLSKSRAYELIRIAEGKTTAEQTRARARAGMAATRTARAAAATARGHGHARASTARGHARAAAATAREGHVVKDDPGVRNVTHSARLMAALATFDALSALEREQFLAARGLTWVVLRGVA